MNALNCLLRYVVYHNVLSSGRYFLRSQMTLLPIATVHSTLSKSYLNWLQSLISSIRMPQTSTSADPAFEPRERR